MNNTSDKSPTEIVVLVHGIWMSGLEMSLLARRLRRYGFRTVHFSYPTVRRSLADNAARLQQFVQTLDADVVHFVAHSLGGLLLRQFFHDFPAQRPGRVVTLGTPHAGSAVAAHLQHNPLGKLLLGRSYPSGLRGDVPAWDGHRALAVIAGSLAVGAGRLIVHLPHPNDGTVAVAETHLLGASAHLVLPVTHMGLLLSRPVAECVCRFLREGRVGPA